MSHVRRKPNKQYNVTTKKRKNKVQTKMLFILLLIFSSAIIGIIFIVLSMSWVWIKMITQRNLIFWENLKVKRTDFAFLIIFIVLTIISIDFLFNESHQKTIENISKYEAFQNLVSAFLITFWVCVIGNLLPFPTPYTWVVCYSCQSFIINLYIPLLMAFVASLGCLVGEIAGYIVGRGTAEIISEDKIENLNILHKSIINHPKLAPILIFLFFKRINFRLLHENLHR